MQEQSPTVQEPSSTVQEPSPVVQEPLPMVQEPSPTVQEPSPTVQKPLPTVLEPSPMVQEPSPMVPEPSPMVPEPSPMVPEPSPMVQEPSLVVQKPSMRTSSATNSIASGTTSKSVTNPNANQAEKWRQDQVINSAGGYSFQVCDMTRLRRFLVLGSENGSYYANKNTLGRENIGCIQRLVAGGRGIEVIDVIKEYSVSGRVAKEDPILLALTNCAMYDNVELQRAAYAVLPEICNIPTKLFKFIGLCQTFINQRRKKNAPKPQPAKFRNLGDKMEELVIGQKRQACETGDSPLDQSSQPKPAKQLKKEIKLKRKFKIVNTTPKNSSGWGRMRRRGISKFYTDETKQPERLLYLLTKYKQREGWSHKQVLGYAHPKIKDGAHSKQAKDLILTYSTRGYEKFNSKASEFRGMIGCNQDVANVIEYVDVLHKINQLSAKSGPNNDIPNEEDEKKLLGFPCTVWKT